MVNLRNGYVACPKCKDDRPYTPAGLAAHYANQHPVHVIVPAVSGPLHDPCPLGNGTISCNNCFFNMNSRCRFGLFQVVKAKEGVR